MNKPTEESTYYVVLGTQGSDKRLHTTDDCRAIEESNTRPVERDAYPEMDVCQYCTDEYEPGEQNWDYQRALRNAAED